VQADVEFLVREHLLLPDTAARRDLEDPALLARLAERIGTRRRLEMLYVLTVSDSTATGPATWTPWVATLVQELFFKVLHEIEGAERVVPVQHPERMERLRAVIPGGPLGEDLVVLVHSGQLPGVEELSVVSPPRAGLLTRLCGVLACHGITIMSAQVQPQADDRIARVFQVADYFGATIPPDRWESVRVDLARALEGRLALDYRLAERAARYAPRVPALRHEHSRVVLENAASESLTIIEVHTVDRIGLLYTIAQALDDLLLDVRLAKVSTLKEKAVDVFYVTDAWGRKLVESDHLQEVERAVVFALDRHERA
jgi:[protein-PII] uridylyltransferase